ncbi:MAG: GNAT family N-acetyltransferase [Chitinophaga sp.]|jgi:predicted GNAT family acetyltransferase
MKEEYKPLPLVKNEGIHHFELTVDGHTAFIDYKESGKKIWLIHTEAPAELEGKGVATALVEKTLVYLEENQYTLVPLCPLVHAYLKRHPEWQRLLDPSVKPF